MAVYRDFIDHAIAAHEVEMSLDLPHDGRRLRKPSSFVARVKSIEAHTDEHLVCTATNMAAIEEYRLELVDSGKPENQILQWLSEPESVSCARRK
jgi:hypothetical protein